MGRIIIFNKYSRKTKAKNMALTKDKKIEIEKRVTEILSTANLPLSPSVDIVSLVKKDDFLVQSGDLPIETTGCIAVNDNEPVDEDGKYNRLIVVNNKFKNPKNEDNIVLKKSRFITAHEYGHFILHKNQNQPLYAHRDTDKRESDIEQEADYFARSILMPADMFIKANEIIDSMISGTTDIDKDDEVKYLNLKIDTLSSFFKVTKDKAKKRLEDIDLLISINS